MRINSKSILLLACAALILATPVRADVPENMNVQGRLTDAAGDPLPAGLKIFTFKIWDAEVGGAEVWPGGPGESQTLPTDADGLWTAQVGRLLGLTEVVFQDTTRWLEVRVDDGVNPAETMPRIKLNTNPYTYRSASSQQADFADDADLLDGLDAGDFALSAHNHSAADITSGTLNTARYSANADLGSEGYLDNNAGTDLLNRNQGDTRWMGISTDDWVNTTGDVMTGNLQVAGTGEIHVTSGANTNAIQLEDFAPGTGDAGSIIIDGYGGGSDFVAQGDGSGDGIFFNLNSGAGTFRVENIGGGVLGVDMFGTSTISFRPNTSLSGSVVFPPGAIQDTEILDEPGVASQSNTNSDQSLTGTMTDIETVTITIPTSGYIHVKGNIYSWITGAAGNSAVGQFQIDETAGGSATAPHYRLNGMFVKNSSNSFHPVYVDRMYFKSAGTYTFRIEGRELSVTGSGNVLSIWPRLTATFFPTAYGSTVTGVSIAESGEFEQSVRSIAASDAGGAKPGTMTHSETAMVDLRELEMRVLRAEAATAKAVRDLEVARNKGLQSVTEAQQEDE